MRTQGEVADHQGVYIIGYPAGTPENISDGAQVTDNTDDATFMANIDTLERSSGSPVFNATTDVLEGIFAHGDKWLPTDLGCNVSVRCHEDENCADEEVTRIRCLPLAADAKGDLQITGATAGDCRDPLP
jgi:hypothetical protein